MTSDTRLLALDWGTSWLRAYRLGAGGAVLEVRRLPRGIRDVVGERAFEQAFDEACGDWLRACPGVAAIACGMVGSAQGWREVPYLDVPLSLDRLASALTPVATASGTTLHIVPGLIERGALPNVMRGEETQIAGALLAVAEGARVLVGLPGTHSKWAQVRDGQITHFHTFMTGEVYEALCAHTLLGRTLVRGGAWDTAAFDRGAGVARSPEGRAGVLATIFSTRSLGLTGVLSPEAQADYLSGLLIGHEIQALGEIDAAEHIILCGDEGLCARYQQVLRASGRSDVVLAAHAPERGLWQVAQLAGLVKASPLRDALARCGLVAILRGVRPAEAAAIGAALYAAGFRAIEVPLNSPDPLASIRILRRALATDCAIGAGTVMSPAEVDDVRAAGGEFVVMPHTDVDVIHAARAAGMEVAPGAATPTEAVAALGAGADVLKMFPAEQLGAATLAAWRAVLPSETPVIAVGGITPETLPAFVSAGASGFGLGSALYRPGLSAAEVAGRAAAFLDALRRAECDQGH